MTTKPVQVRLATSTDPGCADPGAPGGGGNGGVNPVPVEVDPGGDINSGPPKFSPENQLIDRAERLVKPEDEERKMFVQFDAWTDPRILKWLLDNGSTLPPGAQDLFVKDRPPLKDVALLNCGFAMLTGVPLDRAVRQLAGAENSATIDLTTEMQDRLKSLNWTVKDVILALGEYMYNIFRNRFPHYGDDAPSRELKLAFIHFADGRLRISPEGREWMNAEPDSYYFFSFAEFCVQAAYYDAEPGRAFWIQLGSMFAALQDVYCLRYHKENGRRTTQDYGDQNYDGGARKIPDDVLLAHVNSVIDRDDTLDKLVQRVTWNAFWYFFDDVIGE